MIVVDSSVWIDHYNGVRRPETELLHHLVRSSKLPIIVGDVILFEVLVGLRTERSVDVVRAELESFLVVTMLGVDRVEPTLAACRKLRGLGHTMSTVDAFIGCYCLGHGLSLLTRDRAFLAMRNHLGLRLVDPSTFQPNKA